MAIDKSALRVTELDFEQIKTNLKDYLRNQDEFTDYDFSGSGMDVLLDVLAYNTTYMGYYLNAVSNEMFLDTAQLRNSIISHAKMANYVPTSKQGALAKINITVTPSSTESNTATTITLDKYTRLLGQDKDGINYPFVTLYSNTITKSGDTFNFSNVFIKQGEVVTLQYLMETSNESRRFEIPSSNVDTQSIAISVQQSSTNTDISTYTLAQDITELTANSKVYFIEENENQNYTFYFGDNVLGKKPSVGNIIIVTYLDNVGKVSNNISNFTFTEPIAGIYSDNIIVSSAATSYGGVNKETIEEVRFRAPYFYSTQNRAVTKLDYETLLMKDYPFIEAISVWGGEENDPVIYGKVFISIKTTGNYALTNLEKEQIKEQLIETRNVLSVIPEIIDPDYTYIQVHGDVYYDPTLTTLTANQIKQYVIAAIYDYGDSDLNTFNAIFKKSKLQTQLENSEKSITTSDLAVYLQKKVLITPESRRTYKADFKVPIKKGGVTNKLYTFPTITVDDLEGIQREVLFEEVPESITGIESILITNPGINYTSPPTITITGDGTGANATASIVNGRLKNIEVTSAGSNYTRAFISISGGDGSQGAAIARLDTSMGKLRTYYFKTNGEKVIVNDNAGTINYDTGLITIDSLYAYSVTENDFYEENYMIINVPIEKEVIRPSKNRILTIDENDSNSVQVEIIAE